MIHAPQTNILKRRRKILRRDKNIEGDKYPVFRGKKQNSLTDRWNRALYIYDAILYKIQSHMVKVAKVLVTDQIACRKSDEESDLSRLNVSLFTP